MLFLIMQEQAEEKFVENKITKGYYGVVGTPMITEDYKLKLKFFRRIR